MKKSQILCHRGLHLGTQHLQNTRSACLHAFNKGFGVEIDIRANSKGKLVLGHDKAQLTQLSGVLSIANSKQMALHIKEKGLCQKLYELLTKYPDKDYFIFGVLPEEWDEYVETFGADKIAFELDSGDGVEKFEQALNGEHSIIWLSELEGTFPDMKFCLLNNNGRKIYLVTKECYSNSSPYTPVFDFVDAICTDKPLTIMKND